MSRSRAGSLYVCFIVVWSRCILIIEATCPTDWTTGSSDTRCHRVLSQESQFTDVRAARQLCMREGADLATVTDVTEQETISQLIADLSLSVSDAYIGLMDTEGNGSYSWLDNVTTFSYEDFEEAFNASNIRHKADRCVALHSNDSMWTNSTWRRVPCCFKDNIRVVACTKPDTGSVSVDVDKVAEYCFGDCPPDSYRHENNCYKVIQEVPSFNSTYSAELSCYKDNFRLADVIPGLVLDHVISILKQKEVPTAATVYTGLNNLTSQNEFVTVDGTQYSTDPSLTVGTCQYDSSTEKCMALTTASSTWDVFTSALCPKSCCLDLGITIAACERPINTPITPDDEDVFGMHCFGDIDECSSNPCGAGATCEDKILRYYCACPLGFTGVNCETEIDNCDSNPCQNGQNCTNYLDHYVCDCEPGYTGVNCETDINECENVTCTNGGTCKDLLNKAICECPVKYTGELCETLIVCETFTQQVANASKVEVTGNEAGDTIEIVCESGLLLRDRSPNKTLTCLPITEQWDYPLNELGDCARHCSALPEVANVQIQNANTEYGSVVEFVCEKGYQFPDNSTQTNMTCLDTGEWTKQSIPDCEIIRCPELPYYDYMNTDTRNNTYNTTVTFWCDIGYELVDHTTTRTIKCLSTGEWTAPLPPCDPIHCPEIQIPESWSIVRDTDDDTYGSYVTYTCKDDKRMLDGATSREILCDATGEWSDYITNCTDERCFPLPFVANATPSTLDADFGSKSTQTCIPGHRFNAKYKQMTMICNTDGWWKPILSSCEPILCPKLTDVLNTERSTNSTLYDTVVDYKCVKGHYYYPNMTSVVSIRCLDSEQWNDTDLSPCWPIVCSPPPTISNGTVTLPPDNNYNYSALVNYECLTGFKFIDGKIKRTIQCNEFGQWNHSDVSCRVDRCSPVPMADHVIPDTTNTSWYTNVTYRCQKGYEWPNNKSTHHITCQNTGQWNDTDIPYCTIKECTPVQAMANATTNTTSHVFDTYVSYQCDPGFKFPDNETMKVKWCSDMAIWEPGYFPECEIVYCPELEDVENATKNSNDTYYNNHVTYSCLPGYQFPDKSKIWTIYCTENETWSDTPFPCEVVFCPPVPWWTETQFNSTLNEFNAEVSYWCSEGYVFEDSFDNPDAIKTATCTHAKIWEPPIDDCLAKESIAAELRGVTYESPAGVSIGTIACSLTVTVLCCIVLLDTKKLYSDLKVMKRNVTSFIQEMKAKKARSNKVSDSQVNINGTGSSP